MTYDRYFLWLMEKIPGVNRIEARAMYEKPFYALISNDENRITDGYILRERFKYETGEEPPPRDICPCSFLEVLIALAEKIKDIMEDAMDAELNTISRWFAEMVDHLGKPRDRMKWDRYRWDDAMETVMNRSYSASGSGGLFPRVSPEKDQREVEIWYQANGYLMDWYK